MKNEQELLLKQNPFSHVLFITFTLLRYDFNYDDDMFSSFLLFSSTTTTTTTKEN